MRQSRRRPNSPMRMSPTIAAHSLTNTRETAVMPTGENRLPE